MNDAISSNEWTDEAPQGPGLYLYQFTTEWPIHVGRVKKGDWSSRENPEWLYCNGKPLFQMNARWLGPIPEPPNRCP
jgi:hypothetical protein